MSKDTQLICISPWKALSCLTWKRRRRQQACWKQSAILPQLFEGNLYLGLTKIIHPNKTLNTGRHPFALLPFYLSRVSASDSHQGHCRCPFVFPVLCLLDGENVVGQMPLWGKLTEKNKQEHSSDTGQRCIHGEKTVIKLLNLNEMTHPTRASLFRASLSAISWDGTVD